MRNTLYGSLSPAGPEPNQAKDPLGVRRRPKAKGKLQKAEVRRKAHSNM